MHVIWFGLNDLVTTERPVHQMPLVVAEMERVIASIRERTAGMGNHFMVVNLPRPSAAVRLRLHVCEARRDVLDHGAQLFNARLLEMARRHPDVTIVDIFECMERINSDPSAYGLEAAAQGHGVQVDYKGHRPAEITPVATSDEAHPTEVVYRLIARAIANRLIERFDFVDLARTLAPH